MVFVRRRWVCRGVDDGAASSHGPIFGYAKHDQGLLYSPRTAHIDYLSLCAGNKRSPPLPRPPSPACVIPTHQTHGTRGILARGSNTTTYLPTVSDPRSQLNPSNPLRQAAVQPMQHACCRTPMAQAFIRTLPVFITRICAYRDVERDDGGPLRLKARLSSPAYRTRDVVP
jgi:hypothetical protein